LIKKNYECQCRECGILFRADKSTRKFCSKECEILYRTIVRNIKCQFCGKVFRQKKSTQKFCCRECGIKNRTDYNKKGRYICEVCGGEFERYNSQFNGKHHKFCSVECKHKGDSIFFSGENAHCYNPNITQEQRDYNRKYPEYYDWRNKVYERDNYVCQCCGYDKGGNLNVHHFYNYAEHHELRLDIDNGITLCKQCHINFHKKYGYKNNTKAQFDEFLINMSTISEAD
jgi:5-methylcytosine-specific restriction endonuclease McrA